MEDILGRLVSLIPAFLAVIWILRMLGGVRRRRREKAAKQTAEGKPAKSETNKLVTRQRKAFSEDEQEDRLVNGPGRTGPLSLLSPSHLIVPPPLPVEREKPGKTQELSVKQPVSRKQQLERVVQNRVTRAEASDIRRKSLDRIRAKSPLAQAMLWKIILDKPLALEEQN